VKQIPEMLRVPEIVPAVSQLSCTYTAGEIKKNKKHTESSLLKVTILQHRIIL
jgi:hypothetical protein